MELSNTGLAIAIMVVITALASGSALYSNSLGNGVTVEGAQSMIDNREPLAHTHPTIEHGHTEDPKIAELTDALNKKSPTTHTHNYAATTHTHSSSSNTSGDFDLTINRSNLELGDSFLLEGDGPSDERVVAIMEDPDGEEQSGTARTGNNGEFSVAFVIPTSWEDGRYEIFVYISDEQDSIRFDVDN